MVKAKLHGGIRVFRSGLHSGYHLGIDKNKVWAEVKNTQYPGRFINQSERKVTLTSSL